MKAILALAVVLIACTQPFVLYRKAGREALDPQRSKETHFKIDYNGLRVHQGRDKAVIRWKQIIKVGKVSDIYVLYLTKDRAYLVSAAGAGRRKKGTVPESAQGVCSGRIEEGNLR